MPVGFDISSRAMTRPLDDHSRLASTLIAAAVTLPVALGLAASDFGPLSWASIVVAGSVGWLLADIPVRTPARRQIVIAAVAFGLLVAVIAVAGYVLVSMVAAALPGGLVGPESPLGYILFMIIAVAALSPFVAVITSVIGLAWAGLVRQSR